MCIGNGGLARVSLPFPLFCARPAVAKRKNSFRGFDAASAFAAGDANQREKGRTMADIFEKQPDVSFHMCKTMVY
jgi:hypothetical protein